MRARETKPKSWLPFLLGAFAIAAAFGMVRLVRNGNERPSGADASDLDAGAASASDRSAFAAAMASAAMAKNPGLTVDVDEQRFVLTWKEGDVRGEVHLDRSFRDYLKLPADAREAYVQKRAAMITEPSLPETLADAEPHLVAIVRARIDYDVGRIFASTNPAVALPPEPPHVALTDDLWGALAYETEDQFIRIDGTRLKSWGTTFEAEWPNALKRLEARSTNARVLEPSPGSGLRELHFDDDNDSARALVPSVFAKLGLQGDAVVASPREDMLLVAGADDEAALRALADRLVHDWDDGAQNARLLRVRRGDGRIEPFVLDRAHPLVAKLEDLAASADQRDEKLQRDALVAKLGEGSDAPFVASRMRAGNQKTHEELTYVVHTADSEPVLLPRADYVVFRRVDLEKKTATTVACARWDKVYRMRGSAWKETPLRPARWLVTTFPTAREIASMGCDHPLFRRDLDVVTPTQ